MYARATSKRAGSRARGEGRERGNLPVTTSKAPVAQRAGGIHKDFITRDSNLHVLVLTAATYNFARGIPKVIVSGQMLVFHRQGHDFIK